MIKYITVECKLKLKTFKDGKYITTFRGEKKYLDGGRFVFNLENPNELFTSINLNDISELKIKTR